jgi:hypothetical protein
MTLAIIITIIIITIITTIIITTTIIIIIITTIIIIIIIITIIIIIIITITIITITNKAFAATNAVCNGNYSAVVILSTQQPATRETSECANACNFVCV